MSMDKKVSIIVPVYNDEKYLSECINHMLEQTYPLVEIILIENNSSDGSAEICQKLEQRYDNIYFYKLEEHQGPSAARNKGISLATGELICFCDADDYFVGDIISSMVQVMEETNSDYVIADMYSERISANLGVPWKNGKVFQGREIRQEMMPRFIGNISDNDNSLPVWGSVVKCMFKRNIIVDNEITFPIGIHFAEDLIFTLKYLSYCQRTVVLDKVIYFYRFNSRSLMNSFDKYHNDMLFSRIKLISEIKKIMIATDIYEGNEVRLNTSARAYIKECVGNAAKRQDGRSFLDSYKEIHEICFNEISKNAFLSYDSKNMKNRIIYALIRYRCVLILTVYYRMRSGGVL